MTLQQLVLPGVSTIHQAPMAPWGNDKELAKDYKRDPRAFLLERCELWTQACHVQSNWVICATYYLPDFEEVGEAKKPLYRTETSHNEAIWQGKVGLIVAMGPMAFVDEPLLNRYFHESDRRKIGEWAQWDIHDARQATYNRVHCRYLRDTQILTKWDDPRLVY